MPKLVDEVNGFVDGAPGYVEDLTHGRGRLGFLERKYQVVEKVREQVKNGGAESVLGLSDTAVAVTKGVITLIVATVTIIFLTFFMLLEGRAGSSASTASSPSSRSRAGARSAPTSTGPSAATSPATC